MADEPTVTEFQFVNSTIATPKVPQDLAVRALIRKQAMKKASAARRRDGNYGKHNLRQYPVFIIDDGNNTNGERRDSGQELDHQVELARLRNAKKIAERQQWLARFTLGEPIPASPPAKDYELASLKSDFDILDLSTVATLHVNRAARAALSKNAQQVILQLRANKQWSYLSFLPSIYGQMPCLSDAADCVIARARQIISPTRYLEAAAISSYVKALDSLQKALDSPSERFKAEVLCATEILALYELLDPFGETAWIRHAAGAARLIQLRGTKSYNSEFEKALFMAHTGPIMTEALLNNEHCFLETDAWKAVFRSVIKEDALISDRSGIVVELMILKSNIPGLFHDVAEIVESEEPDRVAVDELACRIHDLRVDLLKWHSSYELLLSSAPEILPGSPEYDRGCKTFGTYLSCVILVSRLLGALSPSERVELEHETQMLSNHMLALEVEARSTSSAVCIFMAQTLGVSRATIATSKDWLMGESVEIGPDSPKTEPREVIAGKENNNDSPSN